ncbi:MAG TPA: hypothetical protein VKA21_10255 [Candidatus Binatia bacterium]|nr:hypothetical protein [Candidatus Binatia bacterium]
MAIDYAGAFGETAERNIYVFDQEMARLGVRYFAEYHGVRLRSTRFTIHVPEAWADVVAGVAAKLRRL